MTPADPVDVAEGRRLLEEATPVPWFTGREACLDTIPAPPDGCGDAALDDWAMADEMPACCDESPRPNADAALIAFAVNNLGALLACREAAVGLAEAVEEWGCPSCGYKVGDILQAHPTLGGCMRCVRLREALEAFRAATGG